MSKSTKNNTTVWLSLDEVLAAFHPENPREHNTKDGGDVQHIADSLLELGFATTLTMQEDGYLLSGHGRSEAANWLRQQSLDWFSHRWELWIAKSPERKAIAHLHNERFTPKYWEQVPVTMVTLDEATQKATLVRLNNQNRDGKDDPRKLAALLSKLPKDTQETAGWDSKTATAFISAFVVRKQENELDDEYKGEKQHFERFDATDYTARDDDDSPSPGGMFSSFEQELDDISEEERLSWEDTDNEGSRLELAEVDTESGDFRADNVYYDTAIASHRAILLMSDEMLSRYKELAVVVAQRLGVDTIGETVKSWRPKCIVAALEYIADPRNCPNLQLPKEQNTEKIAKAEDDEESEIQTIDVVAV